MGREIPGDMGWPIIGHSIKFISMQPRMFIREGHAKYGPVFKSHVLGFPQVFVQHADDIKQCLLGEERIVTSLMPPSLELLIAKNSILGQHGEEHHERRGVLMQCLTTSCQQDLAGIMQPIIAGHVESWMSHTAETNTPVDTYPIIKETTFALSQSIVYGEYNQDTNTRIADLFQTLDEGVISLPIDLPFTVFGKAVRAKKALHTELAKDLLAREREYLTRDRDDFGRGYVNALLADRRDRGESGTTNIDAVLCQLTLGLAAANQTTSSALTLVLDGLATRPQLVQQIYQELNDVFGEREELPQMNMSQIRSLTKMDGAIREILRQHCVAFIIPRKTIKDIPMHNGMIAPANWGLCLDTDACMVDGANFAESDQFLPERFSKDAPKDIRPGQWEVNFFGGGSRRCPGAEVAMMTIKIFVAVLVYNAKLRYDTGKKVQFTDLPAPCPKKETPLTMYVERRD
uniref:Cytochrome P450 n=1 Tax=Spongospora subterranea TaxID=70186 RepID=A0A0H5QKZ0_9EUKA|eukprot:CRZ02016.1 hypothetical protein [Spongospora subterranea]